MLTPALRGVAKLCRQALLLRMQTSNVCIYYNPKPLGFSGSDGAAYLGLLLWSFGLLSRELKLLSRGPRFVLGGAFRSFSEPSGGLAGGARRLGAFPGGSPGLSRLPGGAPRIFFESLPPVRRLALNCDVFDERSQRVPRAPNLELPRVRRLLSQL